MLKTRVKRISDNNGRNQENNFSFGSQTGRCRKTAGQNHTARIRKQHRRNQKAEQNRKNKNQQKTNKIRKQGIENHKNGRNHSSVLLTNREVKEEGAPSRSFQLSVLATNRVVKEGRGPFTPRFGHKPRGEGRLPSFHPSVAPANLEVKEGGGPLNSLFWPQTEL